MGFPVGPMERSLLANAGDIRDAALSPVLEDLLK